MSLPSKLVPLYSTFGELLQAQPHRLWSRESLRLELMRLHRRPKLSLRVVDKLIRKASDERTVLIVWHLLSPHYRAR